MADALTEWERDGREYDKAIAALTPHQRTRWYAIEEAHEWFDGESGIALAVLDRAKAKGDLDR